MFNKFKNIVACGSSLLFLSSSLSPILADTVTASSSTNKNSTSTVASASSTAAVNSLSSSKVVLKSSTSDTKTVKSTSTPTEQTASTSTSKSAPKNVTVNTPETAKPVVHNSKPSLSTGIKAAGSNQSGTVQDNMSSTDASSISNKSSSVTVDNSSSQSSNSTGIVSSTISINGEKQLINVDKMIFDNRNDKLVTNKDNVLNINFAPNEKSNLKITFTYDLQPTNNASQVLLHSKGINITVNLVIPQKDGTKKIIKNVSPLITDENGEFTIDFTDLDGAQINDQVYLQILLPDNVKIDGQNNLTYKLKVTNPADKNQDQNQNKQGQGQKDNSQSIKDDDKHSDKKAAKVTSPTDFQKNVRHLQDVEKYNDAPATNQSSQMPQQLDSQGNPVTNTHQTPMLAQTNATDTHAKILTGIGIVTAMIATSIFAVQSKDKRKFS